LSKKYFRITKRTANLSYWLALLLLLVACEAEEGCLDVNAKNYEVDALEACSGCCVYPELLLQVEHSAISSSNDTGLVALDSTYLDDSGNVFRIKDWDYYISNARLYTENGQEATVEDEVELLLNGDNRVLSDNFALLQLPGLGTIPMGTIRFDGSYVGLRFEIGLPAQVQESSPSDWPEEHPLAAQTPAMYLSDGSGYLHQRLQLQLLPDSSSRTLQLPRTLGTISVDLPFDLPLRVDRGFNARFSLRVNYSILLRGADVRNDSASTLHQIIVKNLAEAIELLRVQTDVL